MKEQEKDGGAGTLDPGPSRHACLHVRERVLSHATIIMLPSCFPPSPNSKILYETLGLISGRVGCLGSEWVRER